MAPGFRGVVLASMVSLSVTKLVDVDSDEDSLVSDLASQLNQSTAERFAIKRHEEWQPQQRGDQPALIQKPQHPEQKEAANESEGQDSEKKTDPKAVVLQSEQEREEDSEPGQTQAPLPDAELADKVAQEMDKLLQEEDQQQQESQPPLNDQLANILQNPLLAGKEKDLKQQLQSLKTEIEQQKQQESKTSSLVDAVVVGSAAAEVVAGDSHALPAAAAAAAAAVSVADAAAAPDSASDVAASVVSADAGAPGVAADAAVSVEAVKVAPVAAADVAIPVAAAGAAAPVAAASEAAAPVAASDETDGGRAVVRDPAAASADADASAGAFAEQPQEPKPQQPASLAEESWTYWDVDAWRTGMCAHHGDQSPIDIRRESVNYYNNLTELSYVFQPVLSGSAAVLSAEPFTWKISYAPRQGVVFADGKDFELKGIHIHSPSENTINGQHFPAEAQMVHQAPCGQFLIVSQMLGVGELENPYFRDVWNRFPNSTGAGPAVPALNPYTQLLPLDKSYFRWIGSTTTPPCINNTIWMLMQRPVMIGVRQLDVYRAKLNTIPGNRLAPKDLIPGLAAANFSIELGTNNRPTQPLAGRMVQGFSNFMVQNCSNIPSAAMVSAGQTCLSLEREVRLLRSRAASISKWRLSHGAFAAEDELARKFATYIQNHTAVCTLPSNPFLFEWMGHKYCQRSCYKLGLGYTSDKCTPECESSVSTCTNEVAPQMLTTCENADLFNLCATLKESYRLQLSPKKYCQQSCYDNGHGYENDVC